MHEVRGRGAGAAAWPFGSLDAGPDDAWAGTAACRAEDPALFFGPNRFEPKRERLAREADAKAICATCPAVRACREYALQHDELYGVWGGLGEGDRRAILATRRAAVAHSA